MKVGVINFLKYSLISQDPASEKYKDVEAAKGKKLTPLAHLWIEKDKQSKREPHQEGKFMTNCKIETNQL